MSIEKPQPVTGPGPEGCLTAFIRIPVRVVVLVVVVPVRMLWDVLVVGARFVDRTMVRPVGRALAWFFGRVVGVPAGWLYRHVLTPVGHALAWFLTGVAVVFGWIVERLGIGLSWLLKAVFVWPWVGLWRYVVVPVARYGIAVPAVWLYRHLVTPLGHGLSWALATLVVAPLGALWTYVVVPLVRYGIVVPAAWLYGSVLAPLGRGLVTALFVWPWRHLVVPVVTYGIVVPLSWLWRRVLVPVGREVGDALVVCWRIAGYVSRAVGRAVKWVAWNLVGRPVAWFYRDVCTPVGHFVRDRVWAPARAVAVEAGRAARAALVSARDTVRQARRDAWRALVGGPRSTEAVEPAVTQARTLGSTTAVSGVAPAPEISLRKRG
ncbi:hypothetical protein [Streptomyces solicathayae]|uniref:Integral membrane protein n=1 Tax=Streptomyces solicathayae TaxID=3081768 RepID=A0ABZ0M021_9ACTN|nr:hypothetical protein [Streptomyces sp. HUAS YS2]WOX24389.1 hypothetical protein R2D22_24615 [Streptomyces sp. HUAS YS2]